MLRQGHRAEDRVLALTNATVVLPGIVNSFPLISRVQEVDLISAAAQKKNNRSFSHQSTSLILLIHRAVIRAARYKANYEK